MGSRILTRNNTKNKIEFNPMWSDPMGAIDFCLLCLLNFNVNCLWNSDIATAMCYLTSIYRLSKCLLYVDTPPPVCCDVTSRMANKKQRRCVRAKWSSLNVRINNGKKIIAKRERERYTDNKQHCLAQKIQCMQNIFQLVFILLFTAIAKCVYM